MKHTLRLSVVISLAILAGAIPTLPNQALRIRLQRRSRDVGVPMSAQSAMSERFLGIQRVANHISYTREKYANTFAAYERNTGSHHPLDMRSRPSSSSPFKRARGGKVELHNQDIELWYGNLTIGTPPQDFTVDFDTGSADLMVPDQNCLITCDGHNKYDPSRSSSSRLYDSPSLAAYGSGADGGIQYEDKVSVGGYDIMKQRFGGIIVESLSFSYSDFKPDGLSGLAFRAISAINATTLMDNLRESGQLRRPVFSFKFSTMPGESELLIGDTDYSAFKNDTLVSIPLTEKGYWQVALDELRGPNGQVPESVDMAAIVDTGTTLILAPDDIVRSYYSGIQGARCDGLHNGVCTVPCDTINSTAPSLTFGGREFKVSPEIWNLGPVEDGSPNCIAGLGAFEAAFMIVGDVFLRNVYSVFDFSDDAVVQFAELA